MKTVHLNAKQLANEKDTSTYMHQIFHLPAHAARNLASLEKCLTEYDDDTLIILDDECVQDICKNKYAFDVLMALGRCVENNSHLQIQFDTKNEVR